MCGIAGIVGPDLKGYITAESVQPMIDVLRHRGPDDSGLYISPAGRNVRAGLGHRRLSIIDLEGGHQPMCNEAGDVWITYNGEIYNHRELRIELEAHGHSYQTQSDTETILHAYEQFGKEYVRKLRGMFAFAIWDSRRETLFAARDPLGIKPLYYAIHDSNLFFASEIKAILASACLPAEMNSQALPEFLTFGQTGDEATLFEGIRKLMPGHWLTWDGHDLKVQQYWDWHFDDCQVSKPDEHYSQRFIELLEQSVRLRLMSDVPLGMFLSGGLDSSLIAAIMARQVSDPIKTFSIGFEKPYYHELDFASTVAKHIGADHHEVILTQKDFFATLPRLIWHEDEPLKGPASVALYFVARLASEHVKVVLTGEGSDELFAGYNDRYWVSLMNLRFRSIGALFFPEIIRKSLVRKKLWQMPLSLKVKKALSHTMLYLSPGLEGLLFDNFYSFFTREMQEELLLKSFHRQIQHIDPYKNAVALFDKSNTRNSLHRILYTDVKMYLLELLMKQDQMSMAASIESRVPFLDHDLVTLAGSVPSHLRLRGRLGKWIVKQAAKRFLPDAVIHRPKMGFPVPFETWLREARGVYVSEILLDQRTRGRGYFNMRCIESLLNEHKKGMRDCHRQVWLLLNFELWCRTFFDRETPIQSSGYDKVKCAELSNYSTQA